jgi:hypothetical protein
MVLKLFNFGYFPARNRVRSKSVSQSVSKSEKSSLHIVYAALQNFLEQRARRFKNEVTARAASTITFKQHC